MTTTCNTAMCEAFNGYRSNAAGNMTASTNLGTSIKQPNKNITLLLPPLHQPRYLHLVLVRLNNPYHSWNSSMCEHLREHRVEKQPTNTHVCSSFLHLCTFFLLLPLSSCSIPSPFIPPSHSFLLPSSSFLLPPSRCVHRVLLRRVQPTL